MEWPNFSLAIVQKKLTVKNQINSITLSWIHQVCECLTHLHVLYGLSDGLWPYGLLSGVLWKYGLSGPCLGLIQYNYSKSMVYIQSLGCYTKNFQAYPGYIRLSGVGIISLLLFDSCGLSGFIEWWPPAHIWVVYSWLWSHWEKFLVWSYPS